MLNDPPRPAVWIQSTTAPRPKPGERNTRSDRFPSAPPNTAARQSATPRLRARTASTTATPAMTSADSVTSSG